MGASMRDGARLAIAEINAAGGIKIGDKMMKIETIENGMTKPRTNGER